MTETTPRVSICIPAYNGAEFIGEAIRSVLGQSFGDFELVIIDDGSTDGTVAVARGFVDPRIRIIVNPQNLGPCKNWNKALAEARGKFFKLLPQDDFLYPDCLRRQVEVFDDPANSAVALVCGARNIIDRRGRVLMKRGYGRKHGRFKGRAFGSPLARGFMPRAGTAEVDPRAKPEPPATVDGRRAVRDCVRAGTNLIGEPGAVLIQADVARKIGLFDDTNFYVLDLDFWSRALVEGELFVLPEVLAAFRVAAGSASVRIARSQSRDFRSFIEKLGKDDRFEIRAYDRVIGKARSIANMALRRIIYKWGRAKAD